MTTQEDDRPMVSVGSLFKTSEGILTTALVALCGGVMSKDFDPMVQVAALISMGLAVAGYAMSRARSKS
jgi:hypothetical protein